jgi:histidyl-tRNA synthetase
MSLNLAEKLRSVGITTELTYSGNLSNRFKKADKMGAQFVVIIGEEELKTKSFGLKKLASGEQSRLSETELIQELSKALL